MRPVWGQARATGPSPDRAYHRAGGAPDGRGCACRLGGRTVTAVEPIGGGPYGSEKTL